MASTHISVHHRLMRGQYFEGLRVKVLINSLIETRDDLISSRVFSFQTMVLHYLSNGSANLSFTYQKEQFFVPVVIILKVRNFNVVIRLTDVID